MPHYISMDRENNGFNHHRKYFKPHFMFADLYTWIEKKWFQPQLGNNTGLNTYSLILSFWSRNMKELCADVVPSGAKKQLKVEFHQFHTIDLFEK